MSLSGVDRCPRFQPNFEGQLGSQAHGDVYPFRYGDFANSKRGGSSRPHHRRHSSWLAQDPKSFIVDGNSSDRTREIALEKVIRVHLEPRNGYGRAYRTGFDVDKNDIIVTMDADCTYPAELVPELVKRLLDDDLDFITCDRLSLAEDGSMSGLHGFGNWMLSFTARMLFWYGIKDSQTGMWVFRKSIFVNEKMRPTNDGMPLSEEVKILARRHLGKKKAIEISVPYRPRVGEAEIHTWGDGWKNLKFLFARRFGLHRTRTPWGGLDSNPDSDNGDLPEQTK